MAREEAAEEDPDKAYAEEEAQYEHEAAAGEKAPKKGKGRGKGKGKGRGRGKNKSKQSTGKTDPGSETAAPKALKSDCAQPASPADATTPQKNKSPLKRKTSMHKSSRRREVLQSSAKKLKASGTSPASKEHEPTAASKSQDQDQGAENKKQKIPTKRPTAVMTGEKTEAKDTVGYQGSLKLEVAMVIFNPFKPTPFFDLLRG